MLCFVSCLCGRVLLNQYQYSFIEKFTNRNLNTEMQTFTYPLLLVVANSCFSAIFEGEPSLNMVLMSAKFC